MEGLFQLLFLTHRKFKKIYNYLVLFYLALNGHGSIKIVEIRFMEPLKTVLINVVI